MSGYGWFVPFAVNLLIVAQNARQIRFPLKIWLLWIAVVVVYQGFATADNALQRSIMLLSPIATGLAVSTFRATETDLDYFFRICGYMAIFLLLSVLVKTGIFASGVLPFSSGLAPQVMTGSILGCIFAARNALGSRKDLYFWTSVAVIPVIAVTRMGMVATALSLPLTFAPMKIAKRVLFICLIVIAATSLFVTERIQKKMFFSGEGTVQDVKWDNPDFATHGRKLFWDILQKNISEKPLLGHGANASEEVLRAHTKGLTHPHNDWLRLSHDYGYIGAAIFASTLLFQLVHLLQKAGKTSLQHKILFFAGASSILISALFMLTDNIILYAAFFGHFQFALFGLAYGASTVESSKSGPGHRWSMPRIRW